MQTKLCRIFGNKKKTLPSNKEYMLESFNIDRVVQFGLLHTRWVQTQPSRSVLTLLGFRGPTKRARENLNIFKKYIKT